MIERLSTPEELLRLRYGDISCPVSGIVFHYGMWAYICKTCGTSIHGEGLKITNGVCPNCKSTNFDSVYIGHEIPGMPGGRTGHTGPPPKQPAPPNDKRIVITTVVIVLVIIIGWIIFIIIFNAKRHDPSDNTVYETTAAETTASDNQSGETPAAETTASDNQAEETTAVAETTSSESSTSYEMQAWELLVGNFVGSQIREDGEKFEKRINIIDEGSELRVDCYSQNENKLESTPSGIVHYPKEHINFNGNIIELRFSYQIDFRPLENKIGYFNMHLVMSINNPGILEGENYYRADFLNGITKELTFYLDLSRQ